MLFGAVFGLIIKDPFWAIIIAFLSHYFLDLFPHIEYSIPNIVSKNWKKSLPDFLKVFLDFLLGVLFISLLSKNSLIIYICAFTAILPDGLTLLSSIFPNFLKRHHKIHTEYIHYFTKQKNFPVYGKIFTQIIVVFTSVILLLTH